MPEGSTGKESGGWWLLLPAVLASVAYTAAEGALLGWDLGFPLDDSWIHMQFARQLATGQGLAYRSGDPVAASTAPLWTAVLALLHLLPGSALLWTKLLGVGLFAGGAVALHRLGRRLGLEPWFAGTAGASYAATSWLVWSSLSGMEIPLFVLLAILGTDQHLRERSEGGRRTASLVLFSLATLARPEGMLLLAAALLDDALRFRRHGDELRLRFCAPWRPWHRLLWPVLVLAPVLAYFTAISGSPLPTTFAAKAGDHSAALPGAAYLYTVFGILFRAQPLLTLLAAAGGLVLLRRLGGPRDRGLLPALWVAGLPLAYGVLSGREGAPLVGNFGRYFFPLLPFAILLGVLACQEGAGRIPRRLTVGTLALPTRAMITAVLLLACLPSLLQGAGLYARNVANVHDSDVALARWIDRSLPADAVLAVQDVGAFGYFTPNPLVDLSGLVTPQALVLVREARSAADPTGATGMWRLLELHRPDFVICFPGWFPALTADRARLRPVAVREIPDNVTMAGDRLTIYSTPWSRHAFPPPPGRTAR